MSARPLFVHEVAAWAQFLFVAANAHGDAHSGALIEALRAGQALGIDTQADLADVAAIKGGEGVAQQGQPQAALAPGAQHANLRNPAAAVIPDLAERCPHHLLTFFGQKPQRGVKGLADHVLLPFLEAARDMCPVIAECALNSGVGALNILRAAVAGAHADAFRPGRGWRWFLQHDLHAKIDAGEGVAALFQQVAGGLALCRDLVDQDAARVVWLRCDDGVCPAFHQLYQGTANAQPLPGGMDVAIGQETPAAVIHQDGVAREQAIWRPDQPGVGGEVQVLPVAQDVIGGIGIGLAHFGDVEVAQEGLDGGDVVFRWVAHGVAGW